MQNTKIGLLGYGKMGKAIETLAEAQGCTVVWKFGRDAQQALTHARLREADVVIEFSRPESGFENVLLCLEAGVPVVSGTTGWQEQLPAAKAAALEKEGALLWASNFSVGVNLFFALNTFLAKLMQGQPQYKANLTEIHHIHKLDAPSGTAVTLAEGIIEAKGQYDHWSMENPNANELPITAVREGEVPGTHIIQWESGFDTITIEHKAHTRTGFAIGALVAAKWLVGKKGVFEMKDVLGY
jgi:4-hydroxy-tetrahydrodipicolinate reductase